MISFILWTAHCLIFGLCSYLMYRYKDLLEIKGFWQYLSLRLMSIMPLVNILFLVVLLIVICFHKFEKWIDKIINKIFE